MDIFFDGFLQFKDCFYRWLNIFIFNYPLNSFWYSLSPSYQFSYYSRWEVTNNLFNILEQYINYPLHCSNLDLNVNIEYYDYENYCYPVIHY